MIPETNDPMLIGLSLAAVAIVAGALWLVDRLWGRSGFKRGGFVNQPQGPQITWVTAMDSRTRHLADLQRSPLPWDEAAPRDLGRFGCDGRYRFPRKPWVAPEVRRFSAGSAEGGDGWVPEAGTGIGS